MPTGTPRSVKAMVLNMSVAESQPWIKNLALTEAIPVTGLSSSASAVLCNGDDVCQLTTGMGKANAAASVAALVLGGQFDLSKTYFLIASVARIDPGQGTLGSVAWAGSVVDYGLSWEIDARTLPMGWTTGYLGIETTGPTQMPPLEYGSEVYPLSAALVGKAMSLSSSAALEDDVAAQAYRALYQGPPATDPPRVIQCDTTSADTSWHGALLGRRASAWVNLMSGGTYCTAQLEDNATLTALARGANAGLLDGKRVAILHGAASFDRPYTGQTADASRSADPAGLTPAVDNLYVAGSKLVQDIVTNWTAWQTGVPQ
jgi:purine nucleoside permease